MLTEGDILGETKLLAELSRGGQAVVFRGRPLDAGDDPRRDVALKIIHPHLARHPETLRMLAAEAQAARCVVHANVARVYMLGQERGFHYLVMEFVDGCSVAQLTRGSRTRGRRLSLGEVAAVALPLLDGLAAVHEALDEAGRPLEIVHRDISPQNVLVDRRGHVKLIDFGVSKVTANAASTVTGFLKGKLRYMAPEQAHGRRLDRRADLYAFGIVLWELLVGRPLFDADNELALLDLVRAPNVRPPSALSAEVTPALDEVVLWALAADPAARPESARQLRDRLAAALPAAATEALAQRVGAVLEPEPVTLAVGEPPLTPARTPAERASDVTRAEPRPPSRNGLRLWWVTGAALAAAVGAWLVSARPKATGSAPTAPVLAPRFAEPDPTRTPDDRLPPTALATPPAAASPKAAESAAGAAPANGVTTKRRARRDAARPTSRARSTARASSPYPVYDDPF